MNKILSIMLLLPPFIILSVFPVLPLSAGDVGLARLEPKKDGYFGLNLDWANDSPKQVYRRMGFKPKVYVRFFEFPMSDDDFAILDESAKLVKPHRALLLVTLEPWQGLSSVTQEECDRHTKQFKKVSSRAKIFVRFAHEMNGSWYPWSQQPTAYKEAFARFAESLHKNARNCAMIWAPNYGGGYPFSGGQYEVKPDSPDYTILDTNHDGVVNKLDDPYEPYYPGDEAVDWVGMTIYHWGSSYPWGENEIPEPNKFEQQLTGTYDGLDGDQTMVPDFYHTYCEGKGKPMAVPETSALFVPSTGVSDLEREIKEPWWNEVFSEEVRAKFPGIKMINWFEWRKAESELGGAVVDWRISNNFDMMEAFIAVLQKAGLGVVVK